MPKLTKPVHKVQLSILLILFIISCKNSNDHIPFPGGESEFSQSVSRPFNFSEPQKINWIVSNRDSIKPPEVKRIDFNNLSSKPFYPDGFHPLAMPMDETKFDINALPDATFNLDDFPSQAIRFKISFLELPVTIKAGLPKLKQNAALGIFEFGHDQGLPGSVISAVMQDSNGMLWIATDKGLCRLNGEYLEIYSVVEKVFTGDFATINKLLEDDRGRIWCKTDFQGVYVLDWKAGLVKHFDSPGGFENFSSHISDNEMIKDSRGLIWLGTSQDGIYIVDQQKETIKHLPRLQKSDDGYSKEIIEDNGGKIWIGTNNGVRILDLKTKTIHYLNQNQGFFSDTISCLSKDSEGKIWIGTTATGVAIVDQQTATIKRLSKKHGINSLVNNLVEDDRKRIWLATDNGVYIVESALQKLRLIDTEDGLNDNNIKNITRDNQGQIWIGTFAGVNLVDTRGIMPEHFNTTTRGLSNNDVWSLLEDTQQRIWIGAVKTVDIFDQQRQTIQALGDELKLSHPTNPAILLQDRKGQVWIAEFTKGIRVLDPQTGVVLYFGKEQGLKNSLFVNLMEKDSGQVWAGSFQGIEVIDKDKRTFKQLNKKQGLSGNTTWCLLQDRLGQVWVGTDSGVSIVNTAHGTIRKLIEKKSLINGHVYDMVEDDGGRIWMATVKGIEIADPEKKTLTTITTKEGLAAPDVYTLFKYMGRIYAGTGNGLTVFTPRKKRASSDNSQPEWLIQSYGRGQGLISTNFNSGAALAVNNKLWWGLFPATLTITAIPKEDSNISPTYITSINISDKPQYFIDNNRVQTDLQSDTIWDTKKDTFYIKDKLPADTGYLQKNKITWDSLTGYFNMPVNLTLPYNQNFLSFHFTSTHLDNRDKTRYRYLLEGADKKWSDITDKPYSNSYYNLSPGKYTFRVCSRGANGLWSNPAEFSFTILPPWWQTWWAYLLYVLIFAELVWLIVRYRSRNLKAQNLRLEHKVAVRTTELKQSLEDLKSTQAQLIQSEKMASLGELTAGIAHEIQNPLNFVNNFSEVNRELILEMREEISKGNYDEVNALAKDVEDNEEKINHHGKRADAIVKGMLLHSRSSSGIKEPTNINALADEYLRLAYHGLRAKDKSFNATMETDFDETIGNIHIIPQDIGRVILNLITNAFYAVTEKKKQAGETFEPVVSVSTKKINGKVEIKVRDNGNGIPKRVLDKIFQPFFTTKPTGQGTGLGLSMSYDIVTKGHGGELKVETKDGEFAEFIITLPA